MIATIADVQRPMQTTSRAKPRTRKPIIATGSNSLPSRAIYKPYSKWTAIIAFVVAVILHIAAVVYVQLKPEESAVSISLGAEQFAEVTFEAAPPIPPEPVPPPQDEPLDTPPPAAAPTDFVEEKPVQDAKPPRTSRPRAPIARPQQGGNIGGVSSVGSARAVAVRAPRPVYPYEARRAGITGSGVALLTVNSATGAVTSVVMSQSTNNSILDNATTSAFSRWQFKPGTVTKVRVPITFTLTGAQF
jgi:TonB family protein